MVGEESVVTEEREERVAAQEGEEKVADEECEERLATQEGVESVRPSWLLC